MKILLFDNYDSFTYNILHAVNKLGYTDVEVHRNDQISLEEISRFDKIILSPGPGIPSEAGILLPLIKTYAATKSILGICLGHQAIAEAFGGTLINLEDVYHGVSSLVNFTENDYLFDGIGQTMEVGRYHSWVVSPQQLPDSIKVTALSEENQIMALTHTHYDVKGVQFHPESILTPKGEELLFNFLKH